MAYFRIPVDFVVQAPLQIVHGELIFLDILDSFFTTQSFTDFYRFNKIQGICKLNLLIVSEYGYKKSFNLLYIHEELTRQGVGVTAYIFI